MDFLGGPKETEHFFCLKTGFSLIFLCCDTADVLLFDVF